MSVFLSALEGITDTTVLANPKVLALNKQKGEVIVGRKDGYLTTTTTDTSTVQTVEFLDTGTRLIFRPFIGDDGYIRMEIHPEDSSGGLAQQPAVQDHDRSHQQHHGEGRPHDRDRRTVPRIEHDARAARSRAWATCRSPARCSAISSDSSTREEIIILLTPHIVKDDVAYSRSV